MHRVPEDLSLGLVYMNEIERDSEIDRDRERERERETQ